jgi:hypothetical protein
VVIKTHKEEAKKMRTGGLKTTSSLLVLSLLFVPLVSFAVHHAFGEASGKGNEVSISFSPVSLPYDHVMLIVIDGVRPDVLLAADTPNFDSLAAEGSYTWNAWTVTPSITIAAVPAIFTGATREVHGVIRWDGEIHAETVVEVFEGAGLPCAIVGSDPILGGYSATWCTGYYYHPQADEHFMTLAINMLAENRPYFMAIYNPMPDRRGHAYGHESPEYRESIENADRHVGRLIENLRGLGVFERTLIVITTDHGMTGTSHSYGYENDMRIFSIWRGPGVKKGYQMVDAVYIPPSVTYDETHVAHRIIDIAPTITALTGLRAPENSEGSVIHQIFVISAAIDLDPDTLNLRSMGRWITCYIELPEGYAVENIDLGTVRLIVENENVPAEPWPVEVGDHDNDGIPDLMVKFDRQAVQALLDVGVHELLVTGEVEGMLFEGSDNLRVIDMGMGSLYSVKLRLAENLELRLRFSTYDGEHQAEVPVEPDGKRRVICISHPEGNPVELIELVLAEENRALASLVVTGDDLWDRITAILGYWAEAAAEEKGELFAEIIGILGQWPEAP